MRKKIVYKKVAKERTCSKRRKDEKKEKKMKKNEKYYENKLFDAPGWVHRITLLLNKTNDTLLNRTNLRRLV